MEVEKRIASASKAFGALRRLYSKMPTCQSTPRDRSIEPVCCLSCSMKESVGYHFGG